MTDQLTPPKRISSLMLLFTVIIFSGLSAFVTYSYLSRYGIISPLGKISLPFQPDPLPLLDYSIAHLAETDISTSSIVRDEVISDHPDYTAYRFSILVEGQKVTGQLNLPKSTPPPGGFPIIVMNRGFIEPQGYQTGDGTRPAAAFFASHGFITVAPDFLGHGGSDLEDIDPMAARVKKPVTTLTIFYSLGSLNQFTQADTAKVGMWGHSNGGQISLTVLEILSRSKNWHVPVPTTLWAPVSSAFPYSILYYTDDYDTAGKQLRQVLYEFELNYDTDNYSFHRYLDWIDSPLQLHQGTADDSIPVAWSDRLTNSLESLGKSVTYYTYTGADHNLKPNWGQVIARDLDFFRQNL